MALRLVPRRPHLQRILWLRGLRGYATVKPVTIAAGPPKSALSAPTALDALILSELRKTPTASLPSLVQQFDSNSGKVLKAPLIYESRPSAEKKVKFVENDNSVVMVAHAAQNADRWKVSICSAFALNAPPEASGGPEQSVLLTCAHTLEAVSCLHLLWILLTGFIRRCVVLLSYLQ